MSSVRLDVHWMPPWLPEAWYRGPEDFLLTRAQDLEGCWGAGGWTSWDPDMNTWRDTQQWLSLPAWAHLSPHRSYAEFLKRNTRLQLPAFSGLLPVPSLCPVRSNLSFKVL